MIVKIKFMHYYLKIVTCNKHKSINMEKQKIAIVSGANRGIGKEIVRQLTNEGFKVLATGRKLHKLEQLTTEIEGDIVLVEVDIA